MNKIWISLFFLLSLIFLLRYAIVGQAVYGDGIYYWAYTRSLYFDHDLSFFNELGHNYSHAGNNALDEKLFDRYTNSTAKGLAANRYPPGAPLSWFPFYILADGIVLLLRSAGVTLSRNGYSDIYQIFVGIGNVGYVILGLSFIFLLLKHFFSSRVALITTLFILFATNLFYYGSIDVINSHPFSFFIATMYFYFWQKHLMRRSYSQWFLLGIMLGVLAMIRTQDVLLGIPILAELSVQLIKKYNFVKFFQHGCLVFIGFLLGFLPQLIVWEILYGTFWTSPYLGENSFDFFHPHFLGVLLNPKTGMLYYSPVFIISLFGLWLFRKKNRFISVTFLITFVVQFYLIANWSGWHQGEAYGIRMLISLLPAFSIGIAALIYYLLKKTTMYTAVVICLLFVIYNGIMIGIFQLYIQENSFIRGQNTQQMIMEKFHIKF